MINLIRSKIEIFLFRYDYENCEAEGANKMMKDIEEKFKTSQFIGTKLNFQNKEYIVKEADNYSYKDPVDNSIADKQVDF